ncbi:hypothetical protein KUV57_22955 [Epibacterium sp. DP7N7-1]|nr:hypothetical protein [Epibacterium sp. DP7N7-1]
MPRTAYVHIGTHKTGTTYLQSWMRKNANTLAQLEIVYPDIGLTPKDAAHKVLALEARTAPDTLSETESWAQLADIVAETSGDVVISSETFSDRMKAPEHVRRLVRFFADLGLETKFIIFLRDPPAYLNSLYVQAVKRFNAGCSFEDYAEEKLKQGYCNYAERIEFFAAAAPVIALPFRRDSKALEYVFLEAIGRSSEEIDRCQPQAISVQNPSMGPFAIHVAREIYARLPSDITAPERRRRRLEFKSVLTKLEGFETGFVGCDNAYAEKIRHRVSHQTAVVAAKHFGAPWEDVVPAETMFDRYAAQQELEFPAERVEPLVKTMVDGDFGPRWPFVRRWAYRLKQKATGLFSA